MFAAKSTLHSQLTTFSPAMGRRERERESRGKRERDLTSVAIPSSDDAHIEAKPRDISNNVLRYVGYRCTNEDLVRLIYICTWRTLCVSRFCVLVAWHTYERIKRLLLP